MRAASRVVALTVVAIIAGAPPAAADGPSITLDRGEVAPGEPVVISLADFVGQSITVAVCGNLAKRGSADCNMATSQSERNRPDEDVTLTQLFVHPPPVPCPCLVRAFTAGNGEFAVAPIVVLGHPEAPVVDPAPGPLVDVTVEAEPAPHGLVGSIRTSLGGPTPYAVTVSVRNLTTEALADVVLSGSARSALDDDVVSLALERPGPIGPGQTWEQTIEAEVPAPVVGRLTWSVTAAGAGSTIEVEQAVGTTPVALVVLAIVFVVDVAVMAGRTVARRRRRRRARAGGGGAAVGRERPPVRGHVVGPAPVISSRGLRPRSPSAGRLAGARAPGMSSLRSVIGRTGS